MSIFDVYGYEYRRLIPIGELVVGLRVSLGGVEGNHQRDQSAGTGNGRVWVKVA